MNSKSLNMLAYWLLVVGGLNWGLVGLLNLNVVSMVLGGVPLLEKVVYVLVGLSAVVMLLGKGKK